MVFLLLSPSHTSFSLQESKVPPLPSAILPLFWCSSADRGEKTFERWCRKCRKTTCEREHFTCRLCVTTSTLQASGRGGHRRQGAPRSHGGHDTARRSLCPPAGAVALAHSQQGWFGYRRAQPRGKHTEPTPRHLPVAPLCGCATGMGQGCAYRHAEATTILGLRGKQAAGTGVLAASGSFHVAPPLPGALCFGPRGRQPTAPKWRPSGEASAPCPATCPRVCGSHFLVHGDRAAGTLQLP